MTCERECHALKTFSLSMHIASKTRLFVVDMLPHPVSAFAEDVSRLKILSVEEKSEVRSFL